MKFYQSEFGFKDLHLTRMSAQNIWIGSFSTNALCYDKVGDTYYFNLSGVKKEMVTAEIADGRLMVVATGKVGEKEFNYDYSAYVGSASDFDIKCTFENCVLMVELKKKISKTTIEVKG